VSTAVRTPADLLEEVVTQHAGGGRPVPVRQVFEEFTALGYALSDFKDALRLAQDQGKVTAVPADAVHALYPTP
jgi:hypothetical protein